MQLRAVELLFLFSNPDPIGQIGKVFARRFTGFDGLGDQRQAALLKGGVSVGMLNEQPGGVRGLAADERFPRPAVLIDDLLHPFGVGCVYFAQTLDNGIIGKPGFEWKFPRWIFEPNHELYPRILVGLHSSQKLLPKLIVFRRTHFRFISGQQQPRTETNKPP